MKQNVRSKMSKLYDCPPLTQRKLGSIYRPIQFRDVGLVKLDFILTDHSIVSLGVLGLLGYQDQKEGLFGIEQSQ